MTSRTRAAMCAALPIAMAGLVFAGDAPRAATTTVRPLVKNGGFEEALAGWGGRKHISIDRMVVYDGAASLRIQCGEFGRSAGAVQYLDLKPNTRYAVSFAVKLKDVVPNAKDRYYHYGSCGVFLRFWGGMGVNRFLPGRCLTGTKRWDLYACEVTTTQAAPPYRYHVQACIRQATGTAWFDNIAVRELPPLPAQEP